LLDQLAGSDDRDDGEWLGVRLLRAGDRKDSAQESGNAGRVGQLEHRLVAVSTKPDLDIDDASLRKALADAGYDVKAIARTQRSIEALREQVHEKKK
jgi:hypothetical protein